jgi:hypothetical protein
LSDLTFPEKQLISLASIHVSLIHLNNGTLGSRGHYVSVEHNIYELFTTISRKFVDLNLLDVRRSGRSLDREVYKKISKVQKDNDISALCWIV